MPGTRQWITQTQVCVTLTLLVQDLNAWNPPVDQQTNTGMCDLDITGTRSQCLEPASPIHSTSLEMSEVSSGAYSTPLAK